MLGGKCIAGAVCASIVLVAPAGAKISEAQLSKLIDQSKVLGTDTEVRAELHESEREVVITTNHNPKATDKDCKIDAVLIARKIMDADPGGIAKVRVVFYDRENNRNFRQVTVREGDIKAFASHQITQDTLLAELELVAGQVNPVERFKGRSYKEISQSLEVLPGIRHGERMQLLGQISTLQEKGVSVHPYLVQFFQMEDKVRQGDREGAEKSLESLAEKVNRLTEEYKKNQESIRGPQIGGQVKD